MKMTAEWGSASCRGIPSGNQYSTPRGRHSLALRSGTTDRVRRRAWTQGRRLRRQVGRRLFLPNDGARFGLVRLP